jgi:hypothetical protein
LHGGECKNEKWDRTRDERYIGKSDEGRERAGAMDSKARNEGR